MDNARRLTEKPLLVRLDAAHDAVETRAELSAHENTAFIVKWNPRRANRAYWADKVSNEGRLRHVRPGKQVGLLSVSIPQDQEGRLEPYRLVVRVTIRTADAKAQRLLDPVIALEGWWTNVDLPEEDVIALYENRGVSEQFDSEIKTDLDLERLPSGKFSVNALVLTLGAMVDNVLRIIGHEGLLGDDAPVRHPAKRRRIRTVIQELIVLAARVIRTGRRIKLQFGRHCPGYAAFGRLFVKFCLA